MYEEPYPLILYFCGTLGWDLHQACWKEPSNHTPLLAGIQFCMRILTLETALPLSARRKYKYNPNNTPKHLLSKLHSQWLVKNEGTIFSELHDQLNYGVRVNLGYKSRDQIRYSHDNKICYFANGVIEIQRWKNMLSDLMGRAEEFLSRRLLFNPHDTLDPIDPYIFVDLETNKEFGYSFVSQIPDYRNKARAVIIEACTRSPDFSQYMYMKEQALDFTAEGKHRYNKDAEEFRGLLLLIIILSCGLTGRGTEMLSMRVENQQDTRRNVYIQDGQVVLITWYHKSQAIMDQCKVSLPSD
jgi:hypothetical protein